MSSGRQNKIKGVAIPSELFIDTDTNNEETYEMTTTATVARINRALAKEGLTNIEFVRGEGYCYFIYDEAPHFYECESVYVPYVNSMPLDRWVEIGRDFHAQCQHALAA